MSKGRNVAMAAVVASLLLAGVAMPVSGQQLGSATSSPVPDGIEPQASAGFTKGKYAQLDSLPDWGGIWFLSRDLFGGPGVQPVLKGDYAERFERWRNQVVGNEGVEQRSRSNCSPPGLPKIMQLGQYPYEFLFTPGRVTINQEAWMQTRTIWTDGRKHPEDPDPTFHGHSIGHWESGTLVVETVGILDTLEFGEGRKHSDQFVLHERIYLSPDDPDLLVNDMTMTDPEALAEPYKVTVKYRRDRHGALIEFQCAENDRNPIGDDGKTLFL
jgi:hypothetical protein